MFPDAVQQGFSLSSTKLHYLSTEAIGPYLNKNLLDEIQESGFYATLQLLVD